MRVSAATFDRIHRMALFAPLSRAELREIISICQPVRLKAGEVLFSEGDPDDGMVVLTRGSVEVSTAQEALVISEEGRGAVLGDLGLLDGRPRSATARALSETVGLRVDARAFRVLRNQQHPAVRKLLWQLAQTTSARLRAITDRIRRGARTAGLSPSAGRLAQGAPLRDTERALLARRGPLSDLAPDSRAALLGAMRVYDAQKGALICREDDTGDACYLLLSGSVDVLVRRQGRQEGLATLKAGTLFGQIAFLDGGLRSTTCRSRTDARVLVLRRATLLRLLDAEQPGAFQLLDVLCVMLSAQLRRATQQMQRRAQTTEEASVRAFIAAARAGLGEVDAGEIQYHYAGGYQPA